MSSTNKDENGLCRSQEAAGKLHIQMEGRFGGYSHMVTLGDSEIPGVVARHQNLVL